MAGTRVRSRLASGAGAIAALALLVGGLAGCQFFIDVTVTSTVDAVDADPGDGVCLTAAGDCTLRAAVQETNALGGPATIHLATDTTYTSTINGTLEDAAATGDLDITASSIHIVGNGATIDGGGIDRVIDHHAGTLQIDDATITHGIPSSGAGLRNRGVANLVRVTFRENTSYEYEPSGSAIAHLDGELNIVGGLVSGNSQLSYAGQHGAILQAGGSVTMVGTRVSGNLGHASAYGLGAGTYAAFLQTAGTALIIDSEIDGNETTEYREVCPPGYPCTFLPFTNFAVGVLAAGDVEIRHSHVSGNTTDVATSGPTFYDRGTATVRIAATVINRCTASGVTSQGYNRFGAAACSPVASDAGALTATVDKIPVGTPALCDATTPPAMDLVTRPQGPACDIGPHEQ